MSMFYRLLQNMSSDADLYDQLKDIRIETPQEYQDFVSGRIEPVYPVASVYGPYKAGKYVVDLLRKNLFKKGTKIPPPTTAITTLAKEVEPLFTDKQYEDLTKFYDPPLLDHPFAFDSYEDDKATMGFQDESDLAKEDRERDAKILRRRLIAGSQNERGFTTLPAKESNLSDRNSPMIKSLIDAYETRLKSNTTHPWEPSLDDIEESYYDWNPGGDLEDYSIRELAETYFHRSFLSQAPRPAVYEGRGYFSAPEEGGSGEYFESNYHPLHEFGQIPSPEMAEHNVFGDIPYGSIGTPDAWRKGEPESWTEGLKRNQNTVVYGGRPDRNRNRVQNPYGNVVEWVGSPSRGVYEPETSGWARFNRPDPETPDKPTVFAFEDVGREMEGDFYSEEGYSYPEFGMGEVPASFYAKDVVPRSELFTPKVKPGYDVPEGYYSLAAELATGDKLLEEFSPSEQKSIKKELEFRALQYPVYAENPSEQEIIDRVNKEGNVDISPLKWSELVNVHDEDSVKDFLSSTPLDFTVIKQTPDEYASNSNSFASLIYTGADNNAGHYPRLKDISENRLATGKESPAAFIRYLTDGTLPRTLVVNEAQIDTRNSSEPFLDKARGGYNRLHEKLAQQTLIDWAKSDKEQLMIPIGEYHFQKHHDHNADRRSIGAYLTNILGDIESSNYSQLIESHSEVNSQIVQDMTSEFYDVLNIRDKKNDDGTFDRSKFTNAFDKYTSKWQKILGEYVHPDFEEKLSFDPHDFFSSLASTNPNTIVLSLSDFDADGRVTGEGAVTLSDTYDKHDSAYFDDARKEYQGKANHYDRYLKALKYELKQKGWEGDLIPWNDFDLRQLDHDAEFGDHDLLWGGTKPRPSSYGKRPTHFILKGTPELKNKILEKGFSITQVLDNIKKRQYA